MVAEIILAPDLSGEPVDNVKSGARHVARALSAAGVKVQEQISVCSGKRDFQKAIAAALKRSNIVVTLGGLCKESGGMAKAAVAQGLGLPLEVDKACFRTVENYCKRVGVPLLPDDVALAQIPKGSIPLPGKYGKTPGVIISSKYQHIVMLPADEQDALSMLSDSVIPRIKQAPEITVVRTLRTYGAGEEEVRRNLAGLTGASNPAVTVHKEGNEILVRVTAKSSESEQAAAICTPVLRKAVDLLGDSAYGLDVESLQAAVTEKLKNKGLGLAIAEAGSSGMLTRLISETRDGTDALRYSVIADDDAAKKERLGLTGKLLKKKGPVSEETAVAMADAARKKPGADIGVSLIVGNGRDNRNSHGLVYIAVCGRDNVYVKKLVIGDGDTGQRDMVLDTALSRALNMIRLVVDYHPKWHMGAIPLEEALQGRTVTDLNAYDAPMNNLPRKPGLAKRFFGNYVIRKADRPGVKVRKAIVILATLALIASSAYIGVYLWAAHQAQQHSAEIQDMFTYGEIEPALVPLDFPRGYNQRFAALFTRNEDVVAHVNIPGTRVNYPVVQGPDNDFYLRRNFNREPSDHGVPFMDFRVNMRRESDNMMVYGHNMKDGLMFADLLYYNTFDPVHGGQRALEFFRANHLIEFTTIFQDTAQYKIFAVFLTNADPSHGPVFDYHNFIEAESDEDFTRFIRELQIRSLINTGVDVLPGDKLLTLSTCTYEFDDARFAVVARRLRRGEAAQINLGRVEINPQPLMPDMWYELFGGEPPERLEPGVNVIPPGMEVSAAGMALLGISEQEAGNGRETAPPADDVPAQAAAPPAETAPAPPAAPQQPAAAPHPEPAAPPASAQQQQGTVVLPPQSPAQQGGVVILPERLDIVEPAPPPANNNQQPGAGGARTIPYDGTLRVRADGRELTGDALEIVSRIVQIEVGPSFHTEAIKAQAVAAYTFVRYFNDRGNAAGVLLAPRADPRVENIVAGVLGEAIYFNGRIAFTPYHAISAGATNSSRDVWGGHYAYLISVNSSICRNAPGFERRRNFSLNEMDDLLHSGLGISPGGNPQNWFEILSFTDGGYVRDMRVGGLTNSLRSGARITGRYMRENVLNLRSASFTIEFDNDRDHFVVTTFGHGHGVGMPQHGANLKAQHGWNYIQILNHYFPGAIVR